MLPRLTRRSGRSPSGYRPSISPLSSAWAPPLVARRSRTLSSSPWHDVSGARSALRRTRSGRADCGAPITLQRCRRARQSTRRHMRACVAQIGRRRRSLTEPATARPSMRHRRRGMLALGLHRLDRHGMLARAHTHLDRHQLGHLRPRHVPPRLIPRFVPPRPPAAVAGRSHPPRGCSIGTRRSARAGAHGKSSAPPAIALSRRLQTSSAV